MVGARLDALYGVSPGSLTMTHHTHTHHSPSPESSSDVDCVRLGAPAASLLAAGGIAAPEAREALQPLVRDERSDGADDLPHETRARTRASAKVWPPSAKVKNHPPCQS